MAVTNSVTNQLQINYKFVTSVTPCFSRYKFTVLLHFFRGPDFWFCNTAKPLIAKRLRA